MPALLTCLVGKTLCESPEEDHWSLRNKAAMMIAQICTEFGDSYHTLRTRITRTLLRAFLDLSKSLTTHYGAITGLSMLGADVIRVLIVPNIKEYMSLLDIELGKKSNTVLINEATRCKQALLDALARLGEDYKQQHYQQQQSESRQGQPKEPRQPSSEAKKQLTELIGVSFARELFKHPDFNYIAPAILQAEGTTAAAEKQQQQQQ
ncbi:histone H4-like TAF Taf6, SAGA complex subunit [Spiromyces aspiralis]|uniref:Histone H4-like TAF Taf6, SAGA complex subunit n=1 Tax=Spiromyces aspiralis TaxID=68401 RepID=A0ACC1HV62_9FUNG|nr:histone H4-like TAF Taf6, SAGA complex subunit [Spiromyces aspiralis]